MRRRMSGLTIVTVLGLGAVLGLAAPLVSAQAAGAPIPTAPAPSSAPAAPPGPAPAPARSAGSPASPGSQGATRRVERACPDKGPRLACHAVRQVDPAPPSVAPNASTGTASPAVVPAGYGPAYLRSA